MDNNNISVTYNLPRCTIIHTNAVAIPKFNGKLSTTRPVSSILLVARGTWGVFHCPCQKCRITSSRAPHTFI